MSLELKNVEKKVGIETHIYPTNIKLEKNTINVLLGSTLAGKTTLMQIMAGLDKPTKVKFGLMEKMLLVNKFKKEMYLWFTNNLLITQVLQYLKI